MSAIDISKWAKKAGIQVEQAVKEIKVELMTSVVYDTRVDTGRLRGGWTMTSGAPSFQDSGRIDITGNGVAAEIRALASSDGVEFLSNNVPYAPVWEERDAMIEKNMARLTQIVKKAT